MSCWPTAINSAALWRSLDCLQTVKSHHWQTYDTRGNLNNQDWHWLVLGRKSFKNIVNRRCLSNITFMTSICLPSSLHWETWSHTTINKSLDCCVNMQWSQKRKTGIVWPSLEWKWLKDSGSPWDRSGPRNGGLPSEVTVPPPAVTT